MLINPYNSFNQIVKKIYNEELNEINHNSVIQLKNKRSIRIETKIIYDKFVKEMKIEFKIGNKKMYRIDNLVQFYTRMTNKEFYRYGEKLQFVHTEEMFDEKSQKILAFLMKYSEIIANTNSNANSNYRYYGKVLSENCIIIGNSAIDELFDALKNEVVEITRENESKYVKFTEEDPNIKFQLKQGNEDDYKLIVNKDIYKTTLLKGKKYEYLFTEDKLYRCGKEIENKSLSLFRHFKENYLQEILLGEKELKDLFSIIEPKIDQNIEIDEKIASQVEKYKPEKLIVKMYLDFDKKQYLIADIKFCYGENEFNPLKVEEEKNFKYARNIIEETKALNIFMQTGFMLDVKNYRFILTNEDKIYNFLEEDINNYIKMFEIMATDNFRSKEITRPKIGSIGLKIENNLLSIDLSKINMDFDELEEIIKKYKMRKKYYRLKDGNFLDLEDNKEIDFLDKLITGTDIDYRELRTGEVTVPVSRTLYLNKLLKDIKGIEITKNETYKNIVDEVEQENIQNDQAPEILENVLRPYQKIGYRWLKTLDNYKFGGILADDMGLGKTLQVIALILSIKEKENEESQSRTSIVITPSSLSLNWKNEIEKFETNLKIKVIRGNIEERKKIINELENYDLVITSYELLKRDIELYMEKNYNFRFIIADEAQYLKNNNTKNAKAIKKLKSETKFALTGTPIENSLSELWSIFDFIMPGYLFSYKKFKANYETTIIKEENQEKMRKLKMLIEPFVLRRTKKEVLSELPEKTITILNNEMEEEQKKIYFSYLAQVKQELKDEIALNGFEKSQMKILAALTRLRQICCHPSLFIENYTKGSSKFEQCIEIVKDGINAGHKILLFSSYTTMFEIIEKEFKAQNINYFKLIGSTKVEERIKMVNEFNENKDVKVFLISLKAGGTGLNLVGADMVIHYDPWWNISAENQATDRAYRIGQKNNVQVYKLITKDSIEEKIYELQKKKEELSENILNTNTTFINKMSKDEILKLFD